METKEKIFAKTLELVSRYGIRLMSMDSLAKEMGVSKKTIYQFYTNKEVLIVDCVAHIISELKEKLEPVLKSDKSPLIKICDIYAHSLGIVMQFQGAFFYDLRRQHPKANALLLEFRQLFIQKNVTEFLEEANTKGLLIPTINIPLVCEIHFFHILELVDKFALRANLKHEEILNALVVTNLRGLLKQEHIGLLDHYGTGVGNASL